MSRFFCYGHELGETCVFLDYLENYINLSEIKCSDNYICQKKFKLSHIDMPPYNLMDENLTDVEEILTKCCGTCVEYETINYFSDITEMSKSSINSSDFVYPILASATTTRLHGFYYLPYRDVPEVLYITRIHGWDFLESLSELFPLMIISLLFAVISGFIAWIIETWSNKDEFPRPFAIGWFEGFWWSFISMTTVGYGDKTTKSIPAKLFAVIWISIGMIVCGILTGELTGEIIKANSPPPPDIKGNNVGALLYRDYDAHLIARHGGNIIRNDEDYPDVLDDILQLILKLKRHEIDGFILDKWTFEYYTYVLSEEADIPEMKDAINFFLKETIHVEKRYDGEKLRYGILVKHTDDYEYFKDFVNHNRYQSSTINAIEWRRYMNERNRSISGKFYTKNKSVLFSQPNNFKNSMIVIAAILGVILLFGIVYELKRKSWCFSWNVSGRRKVMNSRRQQACI